MKAGWERTTVNELCSVRTGKKDVNQGNPVGTYPFFTYAREHTFSDEFSFDGEAILIAGNGDVGNLNHYVGKFEAYQRTYVLMDFERVLPRYLFYVFEDGLKPKLFDQRLGNTMPYIKKGMLTGFDVPLPPLDEQKRIVAVLDAAFEGLTRARTHAEANLQNARELFESELEAVFENGRNSWQRLVVSDVGQVQTGSTPKTSVKANFGSFIPFVKPANFNSDGSLMYMIDGLSEQGAAQSRLIDAGSVLMVCIGATIGKVGYSTKQIASNQQINALTPKPAFSYKFMYFQMRSKSFQDSVIFRSGQTTLPIINKSKWSDLELVYPDSLEEQNSVAEKLETLLAASVGLTEQFKAKLTDLDDLRQSILQKAFAGDLT